MPQLILHTRAPREFSDAGASLERAFDRTLTQLERIQRMGKVQAAPAPLNVSLSAS
ncbi:MAG TPA: hypothetical protein VK657_11565 [Terriglobales bacterium]|nr:hypothetical protein [Terriglobales bacterium]